MGGGAPGSLEQRGSGTARAGAARAAFTLWKNRGGGGRGQGGLHAVEK